MLPTTAAAPQEFSPFPQLTFRSFSNFIEKNFSSEIKLSTVLIMLFTVMENPDLLSLHARQQYSLVEGEKVSTINSWIKCLSRAVYARVNSNNSKLLSESDHYNGISENHMISNIAIKLDSFGQLLGLVKYNNKGHLKGSLRPISYKAIEAVHVICPATYKCKTIKYQSQSLIQISRPRDVPLATLIKNNTIHQDVPVLTGKCPSCTTLYSADHERSPEIDDEKVFTRLYLNSAKYIKVGQSTWVDRMFSNAVVNGMYSFHASASAYMEFWNNSFGKTQQHTRSPLSHCQIWQAFVQESICTVATCANMELSLRDNLAIDEITKEAFSVLGEEGAIQAANQHACSECTQKYIKPDTNSVAPATSAAPTSDAMDVDHDMDVANSMDVDHAPVKMVVVDGICFGPQHCAHPGCADELINYRGEVFCAIHTREYGAKCRVVNCEHVKVKDTQACQQHQPQWKKFVAQHKRQSGGGYCKIAQRPAENLPWVANREPRIQPHDEEMEEPVQKNYFKAPSFYCVETVCAPCGVIVAWTKFAKAESPTNILAFLEKVFPTEESRPDYICIDKACRVLRSAVRNKSWDNIWEKTTRFIVDTYHYRNHKDDDELCQKWCNPAPSDGSAPNLVIEEKDKQGRPCWRRAFNTQACEQLNAWIGGFESILRPMTAGNFNWFLHSMLFYHTLHVIAKQERKKASAATSNSDSDHDSDSDNDSDSDSGSDSDGDGKNSSGSGSNSDSDSGIDNDM